MQKTVYQKPELRDANDNIIQEGAFGKNTALSNSTNDGWIDYVMNDLEALHDVVGETSPTLDSNGHVVEPANLAIGDEDGNRIKESYLKLSGGKVTGIASFRTDLRMLDNQDNRWGGLYVPGTTSSVQYLSLYGGTRATGDARLNLYNVGNGKFELTGYSTDGANAYTLTHNNNGALLWRGNELAKVNSQAFTGTPTVPTPANGDNSTKIANTTFVKNNYLSLSGGTLTGNLTVSGKNSSYLVKHTDLEHGVNPTANNDKYFFRVIDNTGERIISFFERVASNGDHQLRFFLSSYTDVSSVISFNFINTHDGIFRYYPGTDNVVELGASNFRWKQLYAGTTTISTSDERLKDNIEAIPDEVLDAWGEVGWYQYQFKDSIEEKGETKARIHTGAIAQRIESVFESHNLDANRYGLLCYDEWKAEEEQKDEDGNVITEAREAGNRYSLRYEEALCMEAAYQRRRADRLEERIEALEKLLMNRTE